MNQTRTISVESACIALGIGRSLGYQLARDGTLPGVMRLGNRLVVSRVRLMKAIDGTQIAEDRAETTEA